MNDTTDATAGTGAAGGTAVHGTVAPGYEPVRDVFAAVLAAEEDHAAQFTALVDGRPVADLWGGPGIGPDSLVGVFSSTKGIGFLAAALLIQDGAIDPDRAVAAYWPEFGAEGKDGVTVRDLLGHRAGAIGTEDGFSVAELADDRVIAERVAPHAPYWRPGAAFGYHSATIGALTGELVRRVSGAPLKEFYEERIRRPYAVDLHLGPSAADEARVLDVLPPRRAGDPERAVAPDSLLGIASNSQHPESMPLHEAPNNPLFRAGGQASFGGVGSARGLAGLYAAAADLLTPATQRAVALAHSAGHDIVLDMTRAYGLGFMVGLPYLGAGAFGHDGAGGSMALLDPRSGLALGYVRRRFPADDPGRVPDAERLARAVRACRLALTGARLPAQR
ncbi:serine hydrolase domain-containing protein [Streptomyces sp. RFCAC02]|uniref:serine hydrolase domain-containing protein n=1 Tax=Streptomyces sp. RFCAC02 TaxID=2499143 RepID=UPI001020356D|nr:serine hydrolase domain-containing protein [Streptomyces sp. RFCAC02]